MADLLESLRRLAIDGVGDEDDESGSGHLRDQVPMADWDRFASAIGVDIVESVEELRAEARSLAAIVRGMGALPDRLITDTPALTILFDQIRSLSSQCEGQIVLDIDAIEVLAYASSRINVGDQLAAHDNAIEQCWIRDVLHGDAAAIEVVRDAIEQEIGDLVHLVDHLNSKIDKRINVVGTSAAMTLGRVRRVYQTLQTFVSGEMKADRRQLMLQNVPNKPKLVPIGRSLTPHCPAKVLGSPGTRPRFPRRRRLIETPHLFEDKQPMR